MIEFAFVVRNLETGEDSDWIELDRLTEEDARAEWNRIVDERFDWEIVDLECPFSIDYYDFRFANFNQLYEAFEVLSQFTDESEILIVEHLLANEDYAIEDLMTEAENRSVILAEDEHRDLGMEYVDQIGIESVVDIENYFDYESFGRNLRFSGFVSEIEDDLPDSADEMSDMFDDELGEYYVTELYGDLNELPREVLETHFDYDRFGRDVAMDYSFVEIYDMRGWVSNY